jgi:tetratricopeptide (TPR) repeat protein
MLTQAIALRPSTLASLYRSRAGLYAEQKDTAAALADLDEAIQREVPNSQRLAEDHLERGRLLVSEKRYEPALEALDTALKLNPALARAHRLRAETLLQLSRYEEAVRAFDSYLAHQGRPSADVYRVRGLAVQHLGNYAGAIEDYTRALALRPDDVPTLNQRGWAYLVSDVPRLAFRDFREALEKDPDNADAFNGRGMARAKLGQHAAAVQDAEEAVKRAPKEMRVQYNAARVCAQAVRQIDADPTQRGPRAAELRSHYQDRALDLLSAALDLVPRGERRGYWQQYVEKDRAFDPVRPTSRFLGLARDSLGDSTSRESVR